MKCDRCGKEMTYTDSKGKKKEYIGLMVEFRVENEKDKKFLEFLKKQWGKHFEKSYTLCYECWINSMLK